MIVITGPGRSGTSLIARAYREVGIDPGGVWDNEIRAGLEDPEVCDLNRRILGSLGISTLGVRRPPPRIDNLPVSEGTRAMLKRFISPELRKKFRNRFENSALNSVRGLTLIDWSRLDWVASQFGDEIRSMSTAMPLCKDPQFAWTLPVWVAASGKIDHVIVTWRDVDAMLESRRIAGHLHFNGTSDAKNAMIYAVGNVLTCVADAGIQHTLLRFPDFTRDLPAVSRRLPLADERTRPDLLAAFERLVIVQRPPGTGDAGAAGSRSSA